MNYFCVAADFKKDTIKEYNNLNKKYEDSKVTETFGQFTVDNNYQSSRNVNDLPKLDINQLGEYIDFSKKYGIGFNYTLNGTCMSNDELSEEGIEKLIDFLNSLKDIGIDSVTLALPALFVIIKKMNFPFKIKASTLCQIMNTNKAIFYKKLGVERIVIDEAINRDFFEIKKITSAFADGVEVIVNARCFIYCPYRMFHYNQVSHNSIGYSNNISVDFYNFRCMLQRCADHSNILRLSWIRPEDLCYYNKVGVNHFKIQGRQSVYHGDPVRTVKSYFDKFFEGNLMELIECFNLPNSFHFYLDNKKLDEFLKPFYEKKGFCQKSCDTCGYCTKYYSSIVDEKEAKEVNDLASIYYTQNDSLNLFLESLKKRTNTKKMDDPFKENSFSF